MAGYILRDGEKSVVLRADQIDRLLGRGDGDAALLYLCLLRNDGAIEPQSLMQSLRFSELRLRAAETALQELGLIDRPVRPQPQEPAQEPVAYTTEEVRRALEEDGEFRMLTDQTQNLLGKRLNTTDLKSLMNLYSAVGLPADVIFLLVSHCVDRTERRYGPGRRRRSTDREGGLLLGAAGPVRSGERRGVPARVQGAPVEARRVYAGAPSRRPPPHPRRGEVHHRLDEHGLPAGDGGPSPMKRRS